jgi:signal transduction protein with GAF and PtsI domain
MQLVVETVAEVIGVEVCSVYLYDKNTDDLTLRATHGLNSAAVGQVRIRIGEGITGWAAREGRPIAVRDVRREPRFHIEPGLGEEPYARCSPCRLFCSASNGSTWAPPSCRA